MSVLSGWKFYLGAAVVIAILVAVWAYGHRRYNAGVASQQAKIQALTVSLSSANDALSAADKATADAQAEANRQRHNAQVALSGAQANAQKASALEAYYAKKLKDAQSAAPATACIAQNVPVALQDY